MNDRDHLPFLMRQAEQAFHDVKSYECNTADDFVALIKNHLEKLFSVPMNTVP